MYGLLLYPLNAPPPTKRGHKIGQISEILKGENVSDVGRKALGSSWLGVDDTGFSFWFTLTSGRTPIVTGNPSLFPIKSSK